jgi:hypothetical protein
MIRTYSKKRNKPDMPEAVTQEAVRAVQERGLSLRPRSHVSVFDRPAGSDYRRTK